MAIGVKDTDEIYRSISIPLKCEDKQWTADHLRYLAAEIDSLAEPILEIKAGISKGFSSLVLEIITFNGK